MKIKTSAEEPRSAGPSELHEDLLVLAAQSGDGPAFAQFTERHSQLLLRTIYRIVNSWEDAEVIFQETMLKAFVRIRSFEGRSRVFYMAYKDRDQFRIDGITKKTPAVHRDSNRQYRR